MFWKILQWLPTVASLILEAEHRPGLGDGATKKGFVLEGAKRELEAIATAVQVGGCSVDELVSHVGKVVDGVVGLFNCFGVFVKSRPAELDTGQTAGPPPGTKARGTGG